MEEPPAGTTILLLSDEASTLLPTIVSRCRVINLRRLPPKADQRLQDLAVRFIKAGLYERLQLASELHNEAKAFLAALMLEVRKLVRSNPRQYASMVESVYKVQEYLDGNGNKKFALDRLAMEL